MQLQKIYREKRPWGEFVEYAKNTPCTVKIITVNPNEATSLQRHSLRDEFWHIISGSGLITIGTDKIEARIGNDHYIPRETNHRLEAGESFLVVLEISTGQFHENDIERLDDRYNRK